MKKLALLFVPLLLLADAPAQATTIQPSPQCVWGQGNCATPNARRAYAAAYVKLKLGCVNPGSPSCQANPSVVYKVTVLETHNAPPECGVWHWNYNVIAIRKVDPFTGVTYYDFVADQGDKHCVTSHPNPPPGCGQPDY